MSITIQISGKANHHTVKHNGIMVGEFSYIPRTFGDGGSLSSYWLISAERGTLLVHGTGYSLKEVYDLMEEYFTLLTSCHFYILSTDPLFEQIIEHEIPYVEWNKDYCKDQTCSVMFIMDETAASAVQLLK